MMETVSLCTLCCLVHLFFSDYADYSVRQEDNEKPREEREILSGQDERIREIT